MQNKQTNKQTAGQTVTRMTNWKTNFLQKTIKKNLWKPRRIEINENFINLNLFYERKTVLEFNIRFKLCPELCM